MIVDSLGRHSLKEDFMEDWTDPGFEVEVYTCRGWREAPDGSFENGF
jgi:hypothetical protein